MYYIHWTHAIFFQGKMLTIDKIHHFIVVSFQSGYMAAQVEEDMLLPYSHATFAAVKEKVEKK